MNLISQRNNGIWQKLLKRNHTPNRKARQLQNPVASILVCGKCGAIMKRKTPKKDRSYIPWYQCPTRGCDCKMIKCDTVENDIYDAMEEWLGEYILQINTCEQPAIDPVASSLETVRGQIMALQQQQDKLCEYPEKEIYSVEMFTKRKATLASEIKQLQYSEAALVQQQSVGDEKKKLPCKSFYHSAYSGQLRHSHHYGEKSALEAGSEKSHRISISG